MRLIQISDCHLLADPRERLNNVSTHGSLRRLLERIKTTEKKADAFIFTGDISQSGDAESYRNLNNLLGFIQRPVYAIPGNHDSLLEMREQLRRRVQCVHSADLGEWQLLLLNSQLGGAERGHINQADLEWLHLWLQRSATKHTLIAVHHPPVTVGSHWIDQIMLDNGAKLLDSLQHHPHVKALIFGHAHQAFEQQVGHIRILGCPSSCFQYRPLSPEFALDPDAKPGYRWLELYADGSLETGITRLKD